jgi:hypothetical protein
MHRMVDDLRRTSLRMYPVSVKLRKSLELLDLNATVVKDVLVSQRSCTTCPKAQPSSNTGPLLVDTFD